MAEGGKVEKQFKVYFNGTKKEEIANAGAKFSKFINNIIRPHANVILLLYNNNFILKNIDSIIKKRIQF